MAATKSPQRERFEVERRRAAFLTFLLTGATGIIIGDTWINSWAGIPAGIIGGCLGYGIIYLYESFMWKREHGAHDE
jgi:hypothetical protein